MIALFPLTKHSRLKLSNDGFEAIGSARDVLSATIHGAPSFGGPRCEFEVKHFLRPLASKQGVVGTISMGSTIRAADG
jgi:hypothetical protein